MFSDINFWAGILIGMCITYIIYLIVSRFGR